MRAASVVPALSSLTAASTSDELSSSIGPSSSESEPPALKDASESSISSLSESSESSELSSMVRPSLDLRRLAGEALPPLPRFLPLLFFTSQPCGDEGRRTKAFFFFF